MIQTVGELLARIFDGRTCGHMSHSTRAWDHLGPSVDTFTDIECTWSATPCALGCRSGRLAKGEAWNLGSCVFDRGGSECRSGRIGTRRGPIALHGRRAVHPAGPGFDPRSTTLFSRHPTPGCRSRRPSFSKPIFTSQSVPERLPPGVGRRNGASHCEAEVRSPRFVLRPAERFELGTEVRLLLHCG